MSNTSQLTWPPTPTPSSWSSADLARAERFRRTVLTNPWIPHKPHHKQAVFLLHDDTREVLYGGAGGGGKTDALLMAALQYADVPGYAALILMRSYADLMLPKAGISRAKEWLAGSGARQVDGGQSWVFPSGASLTFGYLAHEDDKLRYRTAEFQYIAFDELTLFTETQYTYLFTRLRRLAGMNVPLRMRAGTNPGGPGHDWVKKRFISREFLSAPEAEQFTHPWPKDGRVFIPARKEDNPSLDQAEYDLSLAQVDPLTRAQIGRGDWKAHAGGRFKPEWWRTYRDAGDHYLLEDDPKPVIRAELPRVGVCDPANRKTKASKYTAAGIFGDAGGQRVLVLDVLREQLSVEEIVPRLHTRVRRWDPLEWFGIEANGFQIALAKEARDRRRYPFMPTVLELDPQGRSKLTRATPAIIRCEQGLVYLPEDAPWLEDFVSELSQFTGDDKEDGFTDQVDILAYCVLGLDRYGTDSFGDSEPEVLTGGYQWR